MLNYHLYNQEPLLVVWGGSTKQLRRGPQTSLLPSWWPAPVQRHADSENL